MATAKRTKSRPKGTGGLPHYEGWNQTLSSAKEVAKYRRLPIVEVDQPKGELPLYEFVKKGGNKRYYVVTTAPKTLIEKLRRKGVRARLLRATSTKTGKRRTSSS